MTEEKKPRLYEVRIATRIFDIDKAGGAFEVNKAPGDVPYMSFLVEALSPHSAQHAIQYTIDGLTRRMQNEVANGSEYPVEAMLRPKTN